VPLKELEQGSADARSGDELARFRAWESRLQELNAQSRCSGDGAGEAAPFSEEQL